VSPMTFATKGPITDPWLAASVKVPATRGGPPGMANGGWVCGTLAAHLGRGPVEVTLHAPTPLDTPLAVGAADDEATLSHDGRLLASAVRSTVPVRPVAPVAWADAVAAAAAFPGHHDHPFPGCFVCGTERAEGDGLRLFPGPVASAPGRFAAVLAPQPAHAGEDGRLSPAALLGRLRADVRGPLRVGETYVVVAESAGRDGRKAFGRASVYRPDGRLMAASQAVWITPGLAT
jgi:hypothetical protein